MKERKTSGKQTFFVLTTLIVTLLISCTDLKKEQKSVDRKQNKWIDFDWVGDSIGNQYIDKLAITIPFSIEGIPHKFKSQFDLGANLTMVYGNTLKPYLDKYKNVKLDTIANANFENGKKIFFKSIAFRLDTVLFKNLELFYYNGYGEVLTQDSVDTPTIKHIGTIGTDLFKEKYLIIDFPNQRIASLDSLNTHYKNKTSFVDAIQDRHGRLKVPVTINGTTHYFLFDTGASMFPLAVDKDDIEEISKESSATDTLTTSSWGEYYDVHGYKITSDIYIGNFKIETENLKVYDSKKEFKQFYEKEEIMGLMGNSFFLDKRIIVDYKNKRFGIVN